jgi:RimJ/RimL family protein N-acetyltransferase
VRQSPDPKTAQGGQYAKRVIRLHCGRFLIRTIKPEDASERWAAWIADPEAALTLNPRGQKLNRNEIVEYIGNFDQRTHLLLGIFDKASRLHVGILRLDIDHKVHHALINLFIGEPGYRNLGVTSEILIPALDYAFSTRIETIIASVLLRHKRLIKYMLKTGWQMDPRPHALIKSNINGMMLEARYFVLSRETWRIWKNGETANRLKRLLAYHQSSSNQD